MCTPAATIISGSMIHSGLIKRTLGHRFSTGDFRQENQRMLVVTRKAKESIVISDNIVVTVVAVRGDKVRLGIEAPKEVSVHRREVYQAAKRPQAP